RHVMPRRSSSGSRCVELEVRNEIPRKLGMTDGPLLKLERVSRAFGGLMAVRSVDLVVNDGEILGLIGPNGAGKTTLFNLITGVYRPSAGTVHLVGHDITRTPPPRRCKLGIARTFQLVRPF